MFDIILIVVNFFFAGLGLYYGVAFDSSISLWLSGANFVAAVFYTIIKVRIMRLGRGDELG
jgi:1,4-dihydroxy-2-naphthoate octaprenyltransferase